MDNGRHPKWLMKALNKRNFSKEFWDSKNVAPKKKVTVVAQMNAPHESSTKISEDAADNHSKSIWLCIQYGHVKKVHDLIKADPKRLFERSEGGKTLLHFACMHGQPQVLQLLLKAFQVKFGALIVAQAINATDTAYSGMTALLDTCRNVQSSSEMIVQLLEKLIQNGANIECQDYYGCTAIHWCARVGNVTAMRYLTKTIPNIAHIIKIKNDRGHSAIDIADSIVQRGESKRGIDMLLLLRSNLE